MKSLFILTLLLNCHIGLKAHEAAAVQELSTTAVSESQALPTVPISTELPMPTLYLMLLSDHGKKPCSMKVLYNKIIQNWKGENPGLNVCIVTNEDLSTTDTETIKHFSLRTILQNALNFCFSYLKTSQPKFKDCLQAINDLPIHVRCNFMRLMLPFAHRKLNPYVSPIIFYADLSYNAYDLAHLGTKYKHFLSEQGVLMSNGVVLTRYENLPPEQKVCVVSCADGFENSAMMVNIHSTLFTHHFSSFIRSTMVSFIKRTPSGRSSLNPQYVYRLLPQVMYDLMKNNKPGERENPPGVKLMKSLTSLAYFQVYNPSTLEVYDRESPEYQSVLEQEVILLEKELKLSNFHWLAFIEAPKNIFPVMGEVNPQRRSQYTSPICSGGYAIMGSATPAAASPSS